MIGKMLLLGVICLAFSALKYQKAEYELTDDTLRICYDLSGKTRPSEFATKAGTRQFLMTYKRAKT
jgi:hypothetical protein